MFMDKDSWVKETGGNSILFPRSKKLIELDEAIESANLTRDPVQEVDSKSSNELAKKLGALREALYADAINLVSKALEAWINEQFGKHKEHGWHDSRRNQSGAVERLMAEIAHYRQMIGHASDAPMSVLEAARNESIPALFKGCKCILASAKGDLQNSLIDIGVSASSGATLVTNIRKLAHRGEPLAPPGQELRHADNKGVAQQAGEGIHEAEKAIDKLIRESFGVSLSSLRWEAGEEFVADLVSSAVKGLRQELACAVPFIGAIPAAAGLAWAVAKVLEGRAGMGAVNQLGQKLVPSDSKSALESIMTWQREDMQLLKVRAASSTVKLGAQVFTAATCGVASPAALSVGIGNAIVALADTIVERGRQFRESRLLTAYLNGVDGAHPLGPEIFSVSPLAGAYYLLNTPASHIALQFVSLESPGWRREVEALVRFGNLGKARAEAARLIDTSRFRIVRPGAWSFVETYDKTLAKKLDEHYYGYHPDYSVKIPDVKSAGKSEAEAGVPKEASIS